MSQKKLNSLKKLIQSLRTEERSVALKHLSAYDTHNSGQKIKMRQLCKVILKDSDIQYERVKSLVSPEANIGSFNQLIKRTEQRIRESLILDVNILRKGNYGIVFQKRFQIQKQIIECRILGGRGLLVESFRLINSLIKEAKRYELFEELLELLRMKQDKIVHLEGLKVYEEIEEEILHYENIQDYFLEARRTINYYQAKSNFSASSKANTELLKSTMEKLKEYAEYSQSVNIKSMAYLVAMDYFELTEQHIPNHEICVKFLTLIRNEVIIKSRSREVYVLVKLVKNQFNRYRVGSAKGFIGEAENLMKGSKSPLMYEIQVMKSFGHFYTKNYLALKDNLTKLEEFPTSKTELESTKLFYYKAMYYFSIEEFRQANLLLRNLPLLEKDKEGWNVWLKIMRILSAIELYKLDFIDYDIANFKKYMQRIEKKHELSNRDKLVVKILHALDLYNYDFKETFKAVKNTLEALSNEIGEYRWKPLSPEIIIFHDWFISKLNNIRYEPNLERYREKVKKESPE